MTLRCTADIARSFTNTIGRSSNISYTPSMVALPSPHALASILLAIVMFWGFASARIRVEIISLLTIGAIALGLYFFPLAGSAPADGLALAFGGFGHHALITICALMVLGRGLVVTGALDPAARALNVIWQFNSQLGLLVTLIIALLASMIMNDTPVLVLLLPILAQLARKGGMPASRTLIPVNSAILIGGMATTIGTSTNLLVVSIATDLGMQPIGVFHYTEIVLTAALAALPYIWLMMPRLLPDNSRAAAPEQRRYTAALRLDPATATPQDLAAMLPADVRVEPDGAGSAMAETQINISGTQDSLEEAARKLKATLAPRWLIARVRQEAQAAEQDLAQIEMTIAPDSRLIGLTLQTAGLEDIAVLGVHRVRRLFREDATVRATLRDGDVLLVLSTVPNAQAFAQRDGLLILEGGKEMPRSGKAVVALAIMAGAVLFASIGLMPIAISALGGAVLMLVTGCVKFERVGRALSAQVIVLVAASIALGKLVLVTGAAAWIGQMLASALQFLPTAGVLAAIMLFVTVLTNFASNATAAAVGTPIAFSLAKTLALPAEPLVLAVLFGCNLCYATPVAYQTNMMIMSEGEYDFKDYLRTGMPLVALMIVTLSTLLMLRYGL